MTNSVRITLLALLLCSCAREPETAPVTTATPAPVVAPAPAPQLGPIPMEYEEPMVGGARMAVGSDIMANLSRSGEHTVLVRALVAAGLDQALQAPGKFTLFAPTDAAFRAMPQFDELLNPENQDRLVALLNYHLVADKLDADVLAARVMAGNGSAMIQTMQGTPIKVTVGNGSALIIDGKGIAVQITTPNVVQSNGVVQVIGTVLSPP